MRGLAIAAVAVPFMAAPQVHDDYPFSVESPEEQRGEWDLLKLLKTVPGPQAFQPISKSKCPLVNKS